MVTLWFAGILIVLIPYYTLLENALENHPTSSKVYGAWHGVIFSLIVACVSLHLYGMTITIGPKIITAISFVTSFAFSGLCCFYFCKSWRGYTLTTLGSALIALGFVAHPSTFNNVTLALTTLGVCSIIGHRMTKHCVYIVYILMCLFDIYAVWCSNIMNVIIDKYPNFTPAGLGTLATGVSYTGFLGAGDVVFAEIALVAIAHLVDTRRAMLAGSLYVFGIIAIDIARYFGYMMDNFPFMVIIAPITLCLIHRRFRSYMTQNLIMRDYAPL